MNNQILSHIAAPVTNPVGWTPGPWKAMRRPNGDWLILCDNGQSELPMVRANAELIAQAPELLAQRDCLRDALQTILDGFEQGIFIRNIAGDGERDWAVKLIPFVNALGKAKAALAQKGPL